MFVYLEEGEGEGEGEGEEEEEEEVKLYVKCMFFLKDSE